MSLLTMVQETYNILGIGGTTPTSVIGNNEVAVKQLLALANVEGNVLNRTFRYEKTISEVDRKSVV